MKKIVVSVLLLCSLVCQVMTAKDYKLVSPDGKLTLDVKVNDDIVWSLKHGDDILLTDSPVSMTLSEGIVYGKNDKVVKASERSVDQTIKTHIYKKSHVKDTFNELVLKFNWGNHQTQRVYGVKIQTRFDCALILCLKLTFTCFAFHVICDI